MPNVLLDNIAGLGAPSSTTGPLSFGAIWYHRTFSSCAVSANGKVAYFGRTASYDPAMRNLVVASLDSYGTVLGIPRCYPTSAQPLAPINGYPVTTSYQTSIMAILVNSAKSRLYMAEFRQGVNPTTSWLNVYTLDANGYPIGAVRSYADGNSPPGGLGNGAIWGMLMHPKLPLLYMVGSNMGGVVVQALDSEGDPTGPQTYHAFGAVGVGKWSIGISADAKYLYMGTSPDILEVIELDGSGNPTGAYNSYTVSNAQVGAVTDYLRFTMGAHAIYMVRPDPTGSGLPILALWPLDSATGQPIGSALARADIHPPLVGAGTMTIGVDDINSRLWVANPTTFADAWLPGETIVTGITPTSYAINSDGTLGASTPGMSYSQLSNAAVLVPTASGGIPLFFNGSAAPAMGNLVKGYQCRITVTAAAGGSFPLTMNFVSPITRESFAVAVLSALDTPSEWVLLDALLQNQNQQVPIWVSCTSPLTSMTVQLDLADSSGKILKSVTETVDGASQPVWAGAYHIVAGFLLPGYSMSAVALTDAVTGLETLSQRSADYLSAAYLNPVAPADRPKQIITDIYSISGGEANIDVLSNLAQVVALVGFNTVNANWFDGLDPSVVNLTLNDNGLWKRNNASGAVGYWSSNVLAPTFSFNAVDGMTSANLALWAANLVSSVFSNNGGSPSQIVSIHMADEPGWDYPTWLNNLNENVRYQGYLSSFQDYLRKQGLSYTDLGGASWGSLQPIGQSVGNPLTGGPASIENRRLYYWTMRFFTDSANAGMKMGQQAVTTAVGHPVATGVNWNNWIDLWYQATPTTSTPDSASGYMDWMLAGRTSAHTAWTEDWLSDTQANKWSVYAAAMRSSTQAGTQSFGGYVVGPAMGQMPTGGKYKIFPLLGNGAKNYCGYVFGPEFFIPNNCWSELSPTLALMYGAPPAGMSGNVYSEYADANRLIGRSESILYPGVAERSKVAILLPSASGLWDAQYQPSYYGLEIYGLYYAISHGYNISVDFVDDAAVAGGALTNNDYYVLYVVGPSVSAAAQTAITNWINSWSTHNRQLVLVLGAGVADEYNTPTTGFDLLAGLAAGSRTAIRDPAAASVAYWAYFDPYTATILDTNPAFYFRGQTMNIRGPFYALTPLSGAAGPSWVDQVYTSIPPNQQACVTKEYTGSGVSNYVTAFGFFPGYQYYASPNSSHTNHLPQGWSIMAREVAMMPVIRQNPPRTVHIYNGKGPAGQMLAEANEYLTTCPVEALRVNVGGSSPTAIGVVLLNWGGTPFDNLKFKVLNGITSPTTFKLASGAPLSGVSSLGGTNAATMTLDDVDVVLITT